MAESKAIYTPERTEGVVQSRVQSGQQQMRNFSEVLHLS